MPIKIAEGLPVTSQLIDQGVNIIKGDRADMQDIRPIRLIILNLMPTKEATEFQLLRLIGGTSLQIEVDLMHTASYHSKNVTPGHLEKFYTTFDQVKDNYYDGLIITGAPVEQFDFEEVDYYEELVDIITWSETHVFSRFFICWGAQFALNHYHGIEKISLDEKLFGIYTYKKIVDNHPFLRGFNDYYQIPESRHTAMNDEQIRSHPDLEVLSEHEEFGSDIVATKDGRDLFIFGHLEYQRETLELEYQRDVSRNLPIHVPENYYPDDDPSQEPIVSWESYAYILFSNWINETYQETPYDITQIPHHKK